MKRGLAKRHLGFGFAIAIALAVLPACGSDTGDSGASSGGTVEVTLQEFAISTSASSVSVGSVTFNVNNDGPEDVHEFVVIRSDLGLTALPTDDDGAVLEDGEGLEAVDEIEDLAVDASGSLTVDLEAGAYVLICNIVQTEPDGSIESHFAEGMRTSFTVT